MIQAIFDAVMERRVTRLLEHLGASLPDDGPVLDLGSGTGHLSARLETELALEVIAADVSDMHVVGPRPVMIIDGSLPFEKDTFSATLLIFRLHYPRDPVALLTEVARVTQGPILLVQSLHSGPFGYVWLRVREFLWTTVAFHVSKLVGYVPPEAKITMAARRFYTRQALDRDLHDAGLQARTRHERSVLPGRALVVATWMLERND